MKKPRELKNHATMSVDNTAPASGKSGGRPMGSFERLKQNLTVLDELLTITGQHEKLAPFRTIYEMVSDEQMIRLIPYTMMPVHYRNWKFGKAYEQAIKEMRFSHIFEAVINSNPSHCYLGVTNELVMQLLVMAHAKWGHVDFFAHNFRFKETRPESLDARLAQNKEYIQRLIERPDFGVDRVEYIMDAAHALEDHCGMVPSIDDATDKEARQAMETRLLELQLKVPKLVSEFEKDGLRAEIAEIEAKLKNSPIHPTSDILAFIMDEKNNPRLSDEARGLIAIVRDQARYLKPQGLTKIMNEGWASFWEEALLKLLFRMIGLDVTLDSRLACGSFFSMHQRTITDIWFNPYNLGLRLFKSIDRKHGFDEGEVELRYPGVKREVNQDGEELWTKTGKKKKIKVIKRNRDAMLRARTNYDDQSFLRTFLTYEILEEMNLEGLEWVRDRMMQINRMLAKQGWALGVITDPIPTDLAGMMELIEKWGAIAEQTELMRPDLGLPPFPVPMQTLQSMATVLQLVGAYEEDRAKFKQMLIRRTGYASVPVINVVDSGLFTDGSLTLRHEFDENFGPLLQSECKDTVRYVRRLWGRPVRLITKEVESDRNGRPIGSPKPYEYYCDEDGEVKERWLA
jgi:stage V sporulation protein R